MTEDCADTPLDELCRSAARLVHAGPTPPRRVRVQRGDLMVDIEWDNVPASSVEVVADSGEPDGDHYIRAPMVGTFYHAPEPGTQPFVAVGDLVQPGQQVGILESMKLMNPIEADCAGKVAEVLVPNGAAVEYDQPLLRIHQPT